MNAQYRRGVCPGLSAPMQTGDGLLVRITPSGRTIALDAFSALCSAARTHGNGIVEITSRGSIQLRGLSPSSASAFAADVAQLNLGNDGVPVAINPLSGLDPDELIDATAFADDLRLALASASWTQNLSAKVSVVIDGGSALHLDALMADVRLRAAHSNASVCFEVLLGGDAKNARRLGAVALGDAVETVSRLLATLAEQAPKAHMKEAIDRLGIGPFAAEARPRGDLQSVLRIGSEPLGLHDVRDGRIALGVGLPFGHSDADALSELIDAARGAGASGLRTAPSRALLILDLAPDAASALADKVEQFGFVTDPGDLRRRVVACAGAPICASGQIPARRLAPEIARAAAPQKGGVIHVSGCAKGCAHHGPAALTVVGRDGQCDLLMNGASAGTVSVEALPRRVAELVKAGHV
jgi:precorrin-3B synthase